MLYNQKHTCLVPLMSDGFVLELMMFESVEEATHAAEKTIYGSEFGYDIFKEGEGV